MKRFQYYTQNQLPIFPLDIGQLIGENHLVRIISRFVEELSVQLITKPFEKEGKPPYHPKMMMKVLLYSYVAKLFSSRKIERALLQDVTYMWLSGMQTPDHNTVNRFRSYYFKGILDDVFCELLDFMHEHGYIKFRLRGIDKVHLELGYLCIAYNLRKLKKINNFLLLQSDILDKPF